MGGPCLQYVRTPYGRHEERLCPSCTDNFQVVPGGFEYGGITWHSVEQAFQSLKFPIGSVTQVKIERRAPQPNESDSEYSCRTWEMGQSRGGTKIREDWGMVKVKLMTVLNIAKYASSVDYCFDLIETGTNRISANQARGIGRTGMQRSRPTSETSCTRALTFRSCWGLSMTWNQPKLRHY